ncbi:MAG: Aquaglyceroporin, partial [Planctomycetota bacterium]
MADDQNSVVREMLAGFFGTFVLIMFGVGVVAQMILGGETNGSYLSISLCWGLAVVMGVYVAAGVSGAHINNPAVTVSLLVGKRFPPTAAVLLALAAAGCSVPVEIPPVPPVIGQTEHSHEHVHGPDIQHDHDHADFSTGRHDHDHEHPPITPDSP